MPPEVDELEVKAATVTIPEYEQRLQAAHAAHDLDAITEITDEYHDARRERVRNADNRANDGLDDLSTDDLRHRADEEGIDLQGADERGAIVARLRAAKVRAPGDERNRRDW